MGLGAFESERRIAGYFGGAQGKSYGRFGASPQQPKPIKKLTLIDRLVAALTPSSWQKPKGRSLKGYGWTPQPHLPIPQQIPHIPQQIPHIPQQIPHIPPQIPHIPQQHQHQHHPHLQPSAPAGWWWNGATWNYNPNADPNAYLYEQQLPYALGPIFRTYCCKSSLYDDDGNPVISGCGTKISAGSCKNVKGCNWVDCTGL